MNLVRRKGNKEKKTQRGVSVIPERETCCNKTSWNEESSRQTVWGKKAKERKMNGGRDDG